MTSFVNLIQRFLLIVILCISLLCLVLSYSAIWRLQLYESATKKAAKLSSEAGRQLRKTRTTQGAGAIASLASTICSVVILASNYKGTNGGSVPLVLGAACAVVSHVAKRYVAGFWSGSVKVPLGNTEYNDAIRATENLCECLNVVSAFWLGLVGVMFTASSVS